MTSRWACTFSEPIAMTCACILQRLSTPVCVTLLICSLCLSHNTSLIRRSKWTEAPTTVLGPYPNFYQQRVRSWDMSEFVYFYKFVGMSIHRSKRNGHCKGMWILCNDGCNHTQKPIVKEKKHESTEEVRNNKVPLSFREVRIL